MIVEMEISIPCHVVVISQLNRDNLLRCYIKRNNVGRPNSSVCYCIQAEQKVTHLEDLSYIRQRNSQEKYPIFKTEFKVLPSCQNNLLKTIQRRQRTMEQTISTYVYLLRAKTVQFKFSATCSTISIFRHCKSALEIILILFRRMSIECRVQIPALGGT